MNTRLSSPHVVPVGHGSGAGQRGVALPISLVVLVIMMIAAMALIRSVDSTTLVIGNLAIRVDQLNQTDIARRAGIMGVDALLSNDALNIANQANLNYSAVITATNADGIPTVLADGASEFSSATFRSAWTAPALAGRNGTTINYLIERMCGVAGVATEANCHMLTNSPPGCESPCTRAAAAYAYPVVYRITVRVDNDRLGSRAPTFVQEYFTRYTE